MGMKIGDAHISKKHCNFFINKGNAKSQDLENLLKVLGYEVDFVETDLINSKYKDKFGLEFLQTAGVELTKLDF